MRYLARHFAASKPSRSPDFIISHADRIRDLALRVRLLGRVDRGNPIETFLLEKIVIERELRALADSTEGSR